MTGIPMISDKILFSLISFRIRCGVRSLQFWPSISRVIWPNSGGECHDAAAALVALNRADLEVVAEREKKVKQVGPQPRRVSHLP